jgi:ABC-type sugar transport system ATPase subunit
MIGRSLDAIYPDRDHEPGKAVLEVRELSRGSSYGNISLTVRAGEIVGMFGLVGSGRTEIARAICGAQPAQTGRILIDGKDAAIVTPADAIANGIAFITEDRMRDGLALDCPVLDNAGLASMDRFAAGGVLNRARQKDIVTRKLDELNVRPRGSNRPVRQLSGGNQQKVVLAKWMLIENLRIFVFDEPTRGVDIATKVEIYRMLVALAAAGKAILLISSELPEIVGLSDRVIVLRDGRITAELAGPDLSMEAIFAHAAGPERLGAA